MRPDSNQRVSITEALQWQIDYVMDAGSPVSAQILRAVIDDVAHGGEVASHLPTMPRFGDLVGLRVMAAVHRLALDRQAPEVALHLPTLGGAPPRSDKDAAAFRRAVITTLTDHDETLQESLGRTPQTNETGRAALLRCVLSREDSSLPVRLREMGASAGLNLRADHLPGEPSLESGPLPPINDRVGCDLDPVDIGTPEGRALLGSYVWVDDVDRFARLDRAMRVAARVPAEVRRMDARDFVESIRPEAKATTVLWHSAMWVYLPEGTRSSILASISAIGLLAGADRPFVHASWEWDSRVERTDSFSLVVRRWDGGPDDGRPRLLVEGLSHGTRLAAVPGAPWVEEDPLVR